MRIGIVTKEPFPIGLAATNRFTSYAKLLAKNHFVKIFVIKPTESKNARRNNNVSGQYEGIHFEYVNGTTIWPTTKNRFNKLLIIYKGLIFTKRKIKLNGINVIILISNHPIDILYFWLVSKANKIKYVQEKSEFPPYIKQNKGFLYKTLYNLLYRMFDGMIVMTDELKEFFSKLVKRDSKLFHLPMSVDIERFENVKKTQIPHKYFAYCGFGGHNRDGVLEIVKAFYLFHAEYPKIQLYLIGDTKHTPNIDLVFNFVKDHKLEDSIKFIGRVESHKIPQLLVNAECLLQAPKKITTGGFPTKLGEYLASKNPVITTSVGEISYYLADAENALIVKSDDIDGLKDKMIYVMQNTEQAKKIGLSGYKLATKSFYVQSHLSSLENFLNF